VHGGKGGKGNEKDHRDGDRPSRTARFRLGGKGGARRQQSRPGEAEASDHPHRVIFSQQYSSPPGRPPSRRAGRRADYAALLKIWQAKKAPPQYL
jgi:hypothetical protein